MQNKEGNSRGKIEQQQTGHPAKRRCKSKNVDGSTFRQDTCWPPKHRDTPAHNPSRPRPHQDQSSKLGWAAPRPTKRKGPSRSTESPAAIALAIAEITCGSAFETPATGNPVPQILASLRNASISFLGRESLCGSQPQPLDSHRRRKDGEYHH